MTVRLSIAVGWALVGLLVTPITAAELRGETEGHVCKVEGQLDSKTKIAVTMELSPGHEESMEVRDKVGADSAWRRDKYSMWGNWASLDRVLIEINAQAVRIPQSAFEGLHDVRAISVTNGSKGIVFLKVIGGDASESYSATYRIEPSRRIKGQYRVAERVERTGEFPDEVWERTVYHNTIWDEPDM